MMDVVTLRRWRIVCQLGSMKSPAGGHPVECEEGRPTETVEDVQDDRDHHHNRDDESAVAYAEDDSGDGQVDDDGNEREDEAGRQK